MRGAWVWALVLAAAVVSSAGAATVDPVEAWRPMYPFIGTWKGARAGADGSVKVTRSYASSATNHHLEITEAGGGRSHAAVWGIVSLDAERQVLVLRQFAPDGSVSDLTLEPRASTMGPLVFTSLGSGPAKTRITDERTGTKTFVERVERSAGGGPFAVVSETRFERKD